MIEYVFAAAANTFFLALRITFTVVWAIGGLVFGLIRRLLRREPEERTRQLHGSIEGLQVLSPVQCPQCSALNDQTLPVCYQCGTALPETTESLSAQSPAQPRWLWIALALLILAVIVVAIV